MKCCLCGEWIVFAYVNLTDYSPAHIGCFLDLQVEGEREILTIGSDQK